VHDEGDPSVWVVAGCLFEVSLPAGASVRWRYAHSASEVKFLSEEIRGDRHHFRFRAEAPGALAGSASLQFRCDPPGRPVEMQVLIAPESLGP